MGSEARQARGSSWALLSLPGLSSVLGSVARLPLDLPKMETGQNTIGEVLFWGLCLGLDSGPLRGTLWGNAASLSGIMDRNSRIQRQCTCQGMSLNISFVPAVCKAPC